MTGLKTGPNESIVTFPKLHEKNREPISLALGFFAVKDKLHYVKMIPVLHPRG